jgi:hypothetical protein
MKPCRLEDLSGWLEDEATSIPDEAHRRVILEVGRNLDSFVRWPARAELLWAGCDRTLKYHNYPDVLKTLFHERRITADSRSNGPAIVAYLVAGGERPKRNGNHDWTIHHLYDGKFPYPGTVRPSVRAVRDAHHFTQSAGLIAIHPIADALADEFAAFAWRLRGESFVRFGYDPEGAFTRTPDDYGFAGRKCEKVWHCASLVGSV